jgi:hypothetical protein
LALGFLATKARSDVLTISPPADLVPGLVDALEHLRGAEAAALAPDLAAGQPLTARRDLLRELLAVAIDEAGERVRLQSTRLLRGESAAAELRAELARLSALLDLLDAVQAGG